MFRSIVSTLKNSRVKPTFSFRNMCEITCGDTPAPAVETKSSKKSKSKPRKTFETQFKESFPNEFPYEYADTHCHIDAILSRLNESDPAAAENPWTWARLVAERHLGAWSHCITVCCEPESYDAVMALLDNDETGRLYAAFGVHPHEAIKWDNAVEARFVAAMTHPRVVAWGECGLDYYYDKSPREVQQRVFVRQMQLAVQHDKPLVVHSREAEEDTVQLMKEHLPTHWRVHIHCCTSSRAMVEPLLEHFPNLKVGFTGCVTFPSATAIRDTVAAVPVERLLLETDGPFMAPVPFRGAACHSGHVPWVAARLAEEKGVSVEELVRVTRANAREVYGV